MEKTREEIEQMIRDNEPLVGFIINRDYPVYLNDDDARQEALIGLWQACERFNPKKGIFSSYAVRSIRNALHSYWRGEQRLRERYPKVSMDVKVGDTKSGEITLGDTIPSNENIEEDFVDYDGLREILTEQEMEVVKLRVQGYSYSEIGPAIGVSKQWVQYLLARIARKVRRYWDL